MSLNMYIVTVINSETTEKTGLKLTTLVLRRLIDLTKSGKLTWNINHTFEPATATVVMDGTYVSIPDMSTFRIDLSDLFNANKNVVIDKDSFSESLKAESLFHTGLVPAIQKICDTPDEVLINFLKHLSATEVT